MFEVRRYNNDFQLEWNNFIKFSKNGTFLFNRDFMDYHSHRFNDMSLMIYKNEKIEAVLPGNVDGDTFYSHQGLTYGGIVLSNNIKTLDVLQIFELINGFLRVNGITNVVYKPTPHIYHLLPSEEDIYALFRLNAQKIGCFISSTIYQGNKLKFSELRKRGYKKAIREGVTITESNDFSAFWKLLSDNLNQRFNKLPVHTLDEILLLVNNFPENIKLFVAIKDHIVVAGVIAFLTNNVIHFQYIAANIIGKESGALDLLFDELINRKYIDFPIIDFGHSTEDMGNYLNENLIFQKEGFGGRGIVYEIYSYSI